MRQLDLLVSYPRVKRPIAERHQVAEAHRQVAKRFGREYFDGDRMQGYGGYRYDGRWVPIAQRIQREYGLAAGQRVLDVGCAKGFLLHDLCQVIPGLEVAGLDVSGYALEQAMSTVKGRLMQGTAAALPFASNSFDLVISINVIHNLEVPLCRAAVEEMERVSRRFKYVQADSYLNDEQRMNLEHWQLTAATYFDPDGWRKLFKSAGYSGDYSWTLTE